MAENYEDIKAGVDGGFGDVPSPSSDQQTNASTSPQYEEQGALPETSYSTNESAGYGTTDYSSQIAEPNYSSAKQGIDTEWLHQVIESVISEKWDEVVGKFGDFGIWKEKVTNDVISIKQELVRLEERFEQLQGAVLGRVKDYDQGIQGIHTEMRALEKVFEKILDPLTSNIKELTRITEEMKKKK